MTVTCAVSAQPLPADKLPDAQVHFSVQSAAGVSADCVLIGNADGLHLHVNAPRVGTRYVDLVQLALELAATNPGKVA